MASWLSGFANPALLWGTALASVPLLIHLLNRQRYKPMPWAAMRFVLAAYRRTRRRVELENLLLLLLRMAAVALLALAVARPFSGDRDGFVTGDRLWATHDGLSEPRAVAFTPDGALLVAEAQAGRVRRFILVRGARRSSGD